MDQPVLPDSTIVGTRPLVAGGIIRGKPLILKSQSFFAYGYFNVLPGTGPPSPIPHPPYFSDRR